MYYALEGSWMLSRMFSILFGMKGKFNREESGGRGREIKVPKHLEAALCWIPRWKRKNIFESLALCEDLLG